MATNAVGVTKMGNIVPRMGIEPTCLVFQVRVLTITPPRLPDITILPTSTRLCGSLLEMSVQTTTVIMGEGIELVGPVIGEPCTMELAFTQRGVVVIDNRI